MRSVVLLAPRKMQGSTLMTMTTVVRCEDGDRDRHWKARNATLAQALRLARGRSLSQLDAPDPRL